jgi:hypothetical protein
MNKPERDTYEAAFGLILAREKNDAEAFNLLYTTLSPEQEDAVTEALVDIAGHELREHYGNVAEALNVMRERLYDDDATE